MNEFERKEGAFLSQYFSVVDVFFLEKKFNSPLTLRKKIPSPSLSLSLSKPAIPLSHQNWCCSCKMLPECRPREVEILTTPKLQHRISQQCTRYQRILHMKSLLSVPRQSQSSQKHQQKCLIFFRFGPSQSKVNLSQFLLARSDYKPNQSNKGGKGKGGGKANLSRLKTPWNLLKRWIRLESYLFAIF